ncbi:MAG: hypothetical protein Q8P20_03130 [bacterium]|nr:hypothetical protein [bacterium]
MKNMDKEKLKEILDIRKEIKELGDYLKRIKKECEELGLPEKKHRVLKFEQSFFNDWRSNMEKRLQVVEQKLQTA